MKTVRKDEQERIVEKIHVSKTKEQLFWSILFF